MRIRLRNPRVFRGAARWWILPAVVAVVLLALLVFPPSAHVRGPEVKRFYASDSFWNTPISPNAPTDPNSRAAVAVSLVAHAHRIGFSNGAFGIALAYASAKDKVYTIACKGDEGQCNGRKTFRFPIPASTKVATGSDHHLSVIYPSLDDSPFAGRELDIWEAHYDRATDSWSGIGVNILDLYGSGVCEPTRAQRAVGRNCQSSVAAGVAALGGLVRPEEIAQGHIDHALAMATPANLAGYIACPATHTDGNHPGPAIPEGARVQLDPSINVDEQDWPRWIKIIAVALQRYGGINVDYADVPLVRGVSDQNPGVPSWSSVGVPVDRWNNLAILPWNRVRLIATRPCP